MTFGPTTLFDKSALESLNPDEALWFDNFYRTIITPLFYVETLADLTKEVASGRTPEQVVGSMARKTPQMGSIVSVDHRELLIANLCGCYVEMKYRPHIPSGRKIEVDGKEGSFYNNPPQMVAFERWQNQDFLGVENDFARKWRASLSATDLSGMLQLVRHLAGGKATFSDISKVPAFAREIVRGSGGRHATLKAAFEILAIPSQLRPRILKRWKEANGPALDAFAPYAAYVLTVDLFFYLCVDAGFISAERASNRVDMAYLYYLPFCNVFTSKDNLHARVAPLFMTPDQTFLWAIDLKEDLRRLDNYYSAFPESTKSQGITQFASLPPPDCGFRASQLWDKYLPNWRNPPPPISEESQANFETLRTAVSHAVNTKGKSVSSMPEHTGKLEDLDLIVLERRAHIRRGKWRIFPPEFEKAMKG